MKVLRIIVLCVVAQWGLISHGEQVVPYEEVYDVSVMFNGNNPAGGVWKFGVVSGDEFGFGGLKKWDNWDDTLNTYFSDGQCVIAGLENLLNTNPYPAYTISRGLEYTTLPAPEGQFLMHGKSGGIKAGICFKVPHNGILDISESSKYSIFNVVGNIGYFRVLHKKGNQPSEEIMTGWMRYDPDLFNAETPRPFHEASFESFDNKTPIDPTIAITKINAIEVKQGDLIVLDFPNFGTWAGLNLKYKLRHTIDFDGDDDLDANDIDILMLGMRAGVYNEDFDLNNDNTVDNSDLDILIKDVLRTEYGDTNLDGKVDIGDLAKLASNYNSTGGWADGNCNLNDDDKTDIIDLAKLASNYLFCRQSTSNDE